MKKVALITYHAAHNYGSVMQAYATQRAIEEQGFACEIVDFRPRAQRYEYSLYHIPYGVRAGRHELKTMVKDLLHVKYHFQRSRRAERFEEFMQQYYHRTPCAANYRELRQQSWDYSLYMTGSDQSWNDNCCENLYQKQDTSGVYYFDFLPLETTAGRVAFATSIGNMTDAQLAGKKDRICLYQYIASREEKGTERLRQFFSGPMDTVLDPTFLLSRQQWASMAGEQPIIEGEYILLYSLLETPAVQEWYNAIKPYAKRNELQIVAVTPKAYAADAQVKTLRDAGPLEFLNLFSNAKITLVDSFHGLAFSIIFRKTFYALGNRYYPADIRKNNLLALFGMESRLLEKQEDLISASDLPLDYAPYSGKIDAEVEHSRECLKKALSFAE